MKPSGQAPVYHGRFFDGETARPYTVILESRVTVLALVDADTGDERAAWPLYRMRSLPRPDKHAPLTLALQDSVHDPDRYSEARLVLEDRQAADWIAELCPDLHKTPPFGWRAARPYLIWSGAAVASLAFLFWIGIPLLAGMLVHTVPERAQLALGAVVESQVIRLLARQEGKPEDAIICRAPGGQAELEVVVAALTGADADSLPVTVTVLDVDHVNALALPGGRILIFNGLLDFAEHPNALAGVIAHELGHIVEKHPLRGALEKGAAGAVIGILLGDVLGGAIITAAVEYATSAAYTRDMESQADAFALNAMNELGWDVKPFAAFFENLAVKQPGPEGMLQILSTHPPSEDRQRFIAGAAQTGGADAVSEKGWQSILGICG